MKRPLALLAASLVGLVLAGCAGLTVSAVKSFPSSSVFQKGTSGENSRTATIEVAPNCWLKVYDYSYRSSIRAGDDRIAGKWIGPCANGRPDGRGVLLLAHSYFDASGEEESTHAFKFSGTIQNGVGPIEGTVLRDFYTGGGGVMTEKYMDEVWLNPCEATSAPRAGGELLFNVMNCRSGTGKAVPVRSLGSDGLAWFAQAFPDVILGNRSEAAASNPLAGAISLMAQPEVQALAGLAKVRTEQRVAEQRLAQAQTQKKTYEATCADITKSSYWSKECVTGRDKKLSDLNFAEVAAKNQLEAAKAKSSNFAAGQRAESRILSTKSNGAETPADETCLAPYEDQFTKSNKEAKFDPEEWMRRRNMSRQSNHVSSCPTLHYSRYDCSNDFTAGQLDDAGRIGLKCIGDSTVPPGERTSREESLKLSRGRFEATSQVFCPQGSAPTKTTLQLLENKDGRMPFFKVDWVCIWGAQVGRKTL